MGTGKAFTSVQHGTRLTSIAAATVVVAGSLVANGGNEASAQTDDTDNTTPTAFVIKLPSAVSAQGLVESRSSVEAAVPGITVYAWPSPEFDKTLSEGDSFDLFEVATDIAVTGEGISVAIEPESIPSDFISDSGTVDFQVQASDPDAGWTDMSNISVQRVESTDGTAWADPSAEAADVLARDSSNGGTLTATVDLSGASDAIECSEGEECDESEAATEIAMAAASVNSCIVFGGTATYVSSTRPAAKVGASFALGSGSGSRGRLVYSSSSSHSTTAGIAMSANGASWAKNGTKTVSAKWQYAFNWNKSKHRGYYIEIDYGKYRQGYVKHVKTNGKCTSFVDHYGTGYQYRPRFETGGVKSVNHTRPSAYTHCVPVADGVWTRVSSSGSAYSSSGGVKISGKVGFNLSVKSNFSSAKKLQYDVAGNKRVCGRSTGPLLDAVPMLRYAA